MEEDNRRGWPQKKLRHWEKHEEKDIPLILIIFIGDNMGIIK